MSELEETVAELVRYQQWSHKVLHTTDAVVKQIQLNIQDLHVRCLAIEKWIEEYEQKGRS